MISLHVLPYMTFSNLPPKQIPIPGDVTFDPLNLATKSFGLKKSFEDLIYDYRTAELKHGRLAMLAAVAYPTQEIINPILSKALYLPNELADEKLSPSLVNGNLDVSTLVFFLGLASGLEIYSMKIKTGIPADCNLRITDARYGTKDFFDLQEGEVWNGRIAMIATLGYVVQESLLKKPVLF